ncbi:MFS transporter [Streptomyces fulvoviolaceus]|uniref:MFS transporter n=1 Tax=Streptomyces fulvoviolaceus TaxID=285535 RepID=UPI0004C4B54F|nr:MFS transporter [Streptomyces fulvoviolaceus]
MPGNTLTQLRIALTTFFALDGFIFADWVVRIPAIKEQTGASATTLGLALLGVSAGAVITMMLTGRLCRRYGNHQVTVACAVLLSLSIALGAGLGGLVAGTLSPTQHLLGLAGIGLLVTALACRSLLRLQPPAPPESAPRDKPAQHRLSPRTRGLVITFGLIALCTAYGEGALADWGALHLEQDLHATPGVAAVGYSCFALAMTIGRLTGTQLLERLGQTRTLVVGGTTAALGMLLAALAPALWVALLGFVITGLGLANLFPVAVERAGALAGPDGVAIASTLGYGGMLLGPPAIGFMADWFSLPTALTSVAALAAAAVAIAFTTRRAAAH